MEEFGGFKRKNKKGKGKFGIFPPGMEEGTPIKISGNTKKFKSNS